MPKKFQVRLGGGPGTRPPAAALRIVMPWERPVLEKLIAGLFCDAAVRLPGKSSRDSTTAKERSTTPCLHSDGLRARADQCRTLAENFKDECVKAKMLNLADGYDEMAHTAEFVEEWFRAPALAY